MLIHSDAHHSSIPDITIIGAGPAGSVAAIVLARLGWDVTLVDQNRFPRDKVCGECISSLGLDVLRRLNLLTTLQCAKPIILTHTILHAPSGESASIPMPRAMWGLSRRKLDKVLLDAARDAGARIRQRVRCEAVAAAPLSIRLRGLDDNSLTTERPSHLILADGKAALLQSRPAATSDFGVKAHFHHVNGERNAIGLFGLSGNYCGLAPVEDEKWNLAFSVPARRMASHRGNLDNLFAMLLTENKALARQFAEAKRDGQWLVSPLPRFPVIRNWPSGVIPIGNAVAAVEPIGGEGMGLAMRSAELAAIALDESIQRRTPLPAASLQQKFNQLWRVRRFGCRAAAVVLSSPALAEAIIPTLAAGEVLPAAVMFLIGK